MIIVMQLIERPWGVTAYGAASVKSMPDMVRARFRVVRVIGVTVLLHHDGGKGRPRVQRILTDMTDTQRRLATLFGIERYAPTR